MIYYFMKGGVLMKKRGDVGTKKQAYSSEGEAICLGEGLVSSFWFLVSSFKFLVSGF